MAAVNADDIKRIRDSKLFDEKWYLEQYPDVKALGMDPAEHYLWLGAAMGRNPSIKFDTAGYLATNEDVAQAQINPLVHYERFGRSEQRKLNAPPDAKLAPEDAELKKLIIGDTAVAPAGFSKSIREYVHKSNGKKIAVYTAIFGPYDLLKDPEFVHSDVDYICFTDRHDLKSNAYTVQVVSPLFNHQTRNARMLKALSHIFLRNYDVTIWVDGSTKIRGRDFRELVGSHLASHDIALHKHFQRDCIYAEAEECIAQKKDDPFLIEKQIARYRDEKFPENIGLVETAQVLRRHTASVAQFNELWWQMIRDYSVRDQLSFNYAAWKLGKEYAVLPGCQWLDAHFKNHFHGWRPFERQKEPQAAEVALIMLVKDALDMTRRSIESILEKTTYPRFKLVVADNASSPETKAYLAEIQDRDDRVTVVTNSQNLSFSKANNDVAKGVSAPLLLFINNDVEIIDPQWLDILVHELHANDTAAAVGPVLLYPDYKIQSAGIKVSRSGNTIVVPAEEKKAYSHGGDVDAITGACLLVRRSAHEEIGGFDERYFYGQEDIDYCLKLRESGYGIRYAPRCEVLHHESHTRKFTARTLRNREIIKLKWANRLEFNRKSPRDREAARRRSYIEVLKSGPVSYKTFADLAVDIKKNFLLIPDDIDLVVGVPRSGMFPAHIIGQIKNCPVISIDELIGDILPTKGDRPVKELHKKAINALIVDDSINFGNSYFRIKNRLKEDYLGRKCSYKFLAVYGSENWISDEVLTLERCALPRLFQWNYLNHGIARYSCFDLDGVLCVDPCDAENDDGKLYEDFVVGATPLHIPKYKIHAIVTSRLEKYRGLTEQWLRANKVEYDKLFMLDLPSKAERLKLNAHAPFKAEVYASLNDACLFIESNVNQAREIARRSGKRVICTDNDLMY